MAEKGVSRDYLRGIAGFMKSSSESFDYGSDGEARRLAVCIRTLVYDAGGQKSVLGAMGLKDMMFWDYGPDYRPELGLPFSALAVLVIGGKTKRYVPRLANDPRIKPARVPFKAWWDKIVIADPEEGFALSRGAVALAVANTTEGLVNPKLTGFYEGLTGGIEDVPAIELPAVWEDMRSIAAVSVRHMAFELIKSLEDGCPGVFE